MGIELVQIINVLLKKITIYKIRHFDYFLYMLNDTWLQHKKPTYYYWRNCIWRLFIPSKPNHTGPVLKQRWTSLLTIHVHNNKIIIN